MNIGEALRFFRKNGNFRQKEILNDYLDSSSYSRIERGKQEIRVDALTEALKTMSVTEEEFFARVSLDDEQKKFRILYRYCATHLDDELKKEQLLAYYNKIAYKHKNLKDLSNYIGIKVYFSQYWSEIPRLTKQEINEVFKYLNNKSYYQQYDYILISNIVSFLDLPQQDHLVNKAIPVKDEESRDHITLKFAYNIVINVVTAKIYAKDYVNAEKYLEFANKQNESGTNYSYRMNIQYLKNLLAYLKSGEYQYMKRIYYFIAELNNIGDYIHANHIKKEIKLLTYNNSKSYQADDIPKGIMNE